MTLRSTVFAVSISWLWLGIACDCRSAVGAEPAQGAAGEPREFFEEHVRPLLATHCYECHSGKAHKLQANLRVDGRESLVQGGDSGPAIVPGAPDASLLMSAVRYETFEMPPRGKLADGEIAVLERWIADGAWWPPDEADGPGETPPSFDWRARQAAHWAWQPRLRPQPPPVRRPNLSAGPIDAFILARLEAADLAPAPRAAAHQLVRRLYLDLVGLPPTPAQVQAFTAAPTDENFRRLVDHLLESPQFGEKWARHWLDLVRYAETCGHEFDFPIPYASKYRDYVICALNADVPYDEFVREQIAGDLLPEPRRHPVTGANESIVGTAFWFLGEAVHAPTDVRGDETDRMDNQIDVFGKAFLAMTIACARCHDHKFDPIPTTDYYALAGFLQSSRRQLAMLDPAGQISATTAAIAAHRTAGELQLQEAIERAAPALAARWADLLLTAQARRSAATSSGAAGSRYESRRDASPHDDPSAEPLVDRMVAALGDDAIQSPEHPLHVWHVLSAAESDSFETHRTELAARLTAQHHAQQQGLAQMVRFADFRSGQFDDWFVTGSAFGAGPTMFWQWDGPGTEARFSRPHLAHSGRLGAKQHGVLRSPTFTLEHSRIYYRLLARNIQLRLIVDGYVMDVYNSLLFEDHTLERVNTQGRFGWITQSKDLSHYIGHRAHLEIIDQGDGYAAVEGVYFSDADPPPDAVHPLNLQLAANTGLQSLTDLAAAYAEVLRQAAGAPIVMTDRENVEWWNWLLKWKLIPPPDNWSALAQQVEQLQQALPDPELVLAMADGTGEDERLQIRGNHRNVGAAVPRRPPVILAGDEGLCVPRGSGRLELAERLTAPDNPLLARVIVNRLWHHLMGRGIATSVDDFGAMGQPPTHPDLLDWLAGDLIDHDWSLKHTIRQIVHSQTYQRSSAIDDPAADVDPENRWWQRREVRRLTAEQLRDALLAISGGLDAQMYGPSVPVHLTAFMTGRGRPRSGPLDGHGRRSIYIRVQRNFLSPMMLAFDMPAPFSTMGRRSVSNVPAQSLILMNDDFVWQLARRWAEQLGQVSDDPDRRIELAFLQAYARPPRPAEAAQVKQFIETQASLQNHAFDSVDVWTDFCHALWNTKEFLYVF